MAAGFEPSISSSGAATGTNRAQFGAGLSAKDLPLPVAATGEDVAREFPMSTEKIQKSQNSPPLIRASQAASSAIEQKAVEAIAGSRGANISVIA
ncbi:MAG: hypothetical protein O2807_09375 [bacterium]|nr:hypothetical protein [bacterium]